MNKAEIYAFLSRIFSKNIDIELIIELKKNYVLLDVLMGEEKNWFTCKDEKELEKELNIDFSTLFLIHNPPIESAVQEETNEVLVGLQNPVMQFYINHGYELNLNDTSLQTPDHIAIEFGFMQNLVEQSELKVQKRFLEEHLLKVWIPYFIGIKNMATTPFYKNICDFTCEFLASDYEELKSVCI